METKNILVPKINKDLFEKAKVRATRENTTITAKIRQMIEQYGEEQDANILNNN